MMCLFNLYLGHEIYTHMLILFRPIKSLEVLFMSYVFLPLTIVLSHFISRDLSRVSPVWLLAPPSFVSPVSHFVTCLCVFKPSSFLLFSARPYPCVWVLALPSVYQWVFALPAALETFTCLTDCLCSDPGQVKHSELLLVSVLLLCESIPSGCITNLIQF